MAGFSTDTLDLVVDYTILSEMIYDQLIDVTKAQHLTIFSILAGSTGRIILLGPHEPSYWPTISDSRYPSDTKPYTMARPVGALTCGNYDLNACWGYMRTDPEQSCLSAGCIAHRACPMSSLHPRIAEHSAYRMQQFPK